MLNILRTLLIVLIAFFSLILLAELYSGGVIDVGEIRIVRARIATPTITLCILFALYFLLRKSLPFKEAISENSIILLSCFVLILYLGNYQTSPASDTVPARYLPFSMLREGNFDLDEFPGLHSRAAVSGLKKTEDHYVSSYPVGAPIIALPVYLPSAIGPVPANSWFTSDLEKLAASLTVWLSVIVFYFAILPLTSRRMALVITAIYALGTTSFSVSSQALWQHGASQLSLTAALYCLVRGVKEPLWMSLAGFPAAFAVVCRPTDALLVAPMGLYLLFHYSRRFFGFLLAAMPPILFQLVYNYYYFDNPFRTQWEVTSGSFWSTPLIDGATNILFSPARGLIIYSPIFLFAIAGMIFAWRKNGQLLLRYLSFGVIANFLLYSKFFMWWGGFSFGPRLLSDLSPILCLFLCNIPELLNRKFLRYAFVILALFSITANGIGVYANDPIWNFDMEIDSKPENAWNWKDNQLVNGPRRKLSSAWIRITGMPTTETAPELFNAEVYSDPAHFIYIRPSKSIRLQISVKNTGKAVWLYGAQKPGNVSFVFSWHRKGRTLERFIIRRRLRYHVFPGESYKLSVELDAPEREGRYDLHIGLVLTQTDSEILSKPFRIPVRVM